jgi:hypothetical protein
VKQAIEACLEEDLKSADVVIQRVQRLAGLERARASPVFDDDMQVTPRVDVPIPNLSLFDQLLCDPISSGVMSV